MRSNKYFVALLLLLLGIPAYAGFEFKFTPATPPDPDRQWNIVCFDDKGLITVLDTMVNVQQFTRNDPWQTISKQDFNKLGCSYAQIPPGSKARRIGIIGTTNGLIFPLIQVKYGNTGQLMYSADSVFLAEHWMLTRYCGRAQSFSREICIVPRSCEVLDGFINVSGSPLPDYIKVPRICRGYTIM